MSDWKRFSVWMGVIAWCFFSLAFDVRAQDDPLELAANTIIIKKKAVASVPAAGGIQHASGTWYGSDISHPETQEGTFSITIPADADCLIVSVSGYTSTVSGYTSGGLGVIISPATSPDVEVGADASTAAYQGALWVFLNPPTGSQTISYSFNGSSSNNGPIFAWAAYKGVGSVGDTDSIQAATLSIASYSLTMTTGVGNLVFASVSGYDAGDQSSTWSNIAKIADYNLVDANLSIAEMTADGASEVIGGEYESNRSDGGIIAVVLVQE